MKHCAYIWAWVSRTRAQMRAAGRARQRADGPLRKRRTRVLITSAVLLARLPSCSAHTRARASVSSGITASLPKRDAAAR